MTDSQPVSLGNPGSWKPIRLLAMFFHGSIQGEQISGSVKRFLEVSRVFPQFGVEVHTLEYSPRLQRPRGWKARSYAFAGGWEPVSFNRVVNLLRLAILSATWGRRLRCDAIYSPDRTEDELIPAFIASLLLRKPLVVVIHSLHVEEVRIGLRDLFRSMLRSNKGPKKALAKTILEVLLRLGYHRTSGFLVVSGFTARLVADELPPRRIVVAGNGVGEDWFNLEPAIKSRDACYLGTISPEKRQILLVHAWKDVCQVRPESALALIGGNGGVKYTKECDGLIQELGLGRNVFMTGYLEDSEARSWVNSSRVFISASRWEGFGLSVLEAMAAGLPCIISDIPAFRENFGKAAILVGSPDPRDWAAEVIGLLADKEVQGRLADSGRKLAQEFRWEEVGRKEAELIHSLAGTRLGRQMGPAPHAGRFLG